MAVSLGIAAIGWSNDALAEPGGDIPLEQCLREARMAGYSGIEKGGKFPNDAGTLGPLLDDYGLRLASGRFSGGLLELTIDEEKKRIKQQLELFQELGVPVMVYTETTGTLQNRSDMPLSRRPTLKRDDIRRYGEKLTRFAEWLEAEQCPMAYHPHIGTVIETEEEIDLLMENSDDAVGLLLDTGHLTFAGGDVSATIRRWGHRINHVHVKDVRADVLERARSRDWSFPGCVLAGVFTVPGDGSIDFRACLADLVAAGYSSGWIVVEAEQDPAKANPLKMAETGMAELREAVRLADLESSN